MRILLALAVSFFVMACQEHHEPLAHKLKKNTTPIQDPIPKELGQNLYQGTTVPSKVQGKAMKPFLVQTRTENISHFPCSNCHNGKVTKGEIPKSHWDQKIEHAPGMKCTTCHDNTKGMKLLAFEGEEIGFNHSYQACAKCHFQQVQDWTGGAHGKRLGGWAGPRKVTNCASCHNPHKPAFESKMPAIQMPQM